MNALAENPSLWEDQEQAQKILKERTGLDAKISLMKILQAELDDNFGLIELGEMEGDDAIVAEAEKNIFTLKNEVTKRGLASLLSGELDANDAYLQINAGAGGTEACDWAGMVLRMYMRWADEKGYRISLMDKQDGDVAGIKNAVLEVKGENAYGWLKSESGVHRLVRISPFDSSARRHTSFCSVSVTPMVDENIDIKVEDKDLRVDTYRSAGAGGQHVNKTDSAVRLTHLPTGIVAACQNQRSQHQNRAAAMKMLKAKLYELEVQAKQALKDQTESEKSEIGFGYQIRSYVLHPYRLVKDIRTEFETSDTQGVLDGNLDQFLEASLAQKLDKEDGKNVAYEDVK